MLVVSLGSMVHLALAWAPVARGLKVNVQTCSVGDCDSLFRSCLRATFAVADSGLVQNAKVQKGELRANLRRRPMLWEPRSWWRG